MGIYVWLNVFTNCTKKQTNPSIVATNSQNQITVEPSNNNIVNEKKPIPGLSLGRGYSIDSDMLKNHILKDEYLNGKEVCHLFDDDNCYDIQDWIDKKPIPHATASISEDNSVFRSLLDYQQWKKTKKTSGGGFFGISGSSSSESYEYSRFFESSKAAIYKKSEQRNVWEVMTKVDLCPYTTDEFKAAVDKLPIYYNDSTKNEYFQFISDWGCHCCS